MVEDFKQMDLDYVLHTYARDYVHFVKGSGARLFDERGRDYIDFGSGIAVCSVGHGNERLARLLVSKLIISFTLLIFILLNHKQDLLKGL